MSYIKRVAVKIRQGVVPLIQDHEKWLKSWSIEGSWTEIWVLEFRGKVRRRGARVSTLKNGSRDG
jgi:hypothetical protein